MLRNAKSPELVNVIRVAVRNVEQSSGVALDDPAIVQFKHNVVRTVGELKVAKAKRQDQDLAAISHTGLFCGEQSGVESH